MARTPEQTVDGSLASRSPPLPRAEEAVFEPGTVLGSRYRLIRRIARGGMGEVYEAEDLELATPIACKTIRAERIGDPDAVARLKQEILAARKVTHANVVRLFDVGFHVLPDQREVAFVTMELLAGETLEARIRREGRLALPAALAIARQLAAALEAAHAARIVHRDLKSQNVILVGDRAIVTDFGLAHAADRIDVTASSDFAGTPAYMAPEQVTGSREIGPAADIYAFGVVLFEMVTGELPFRRDTALATAAARLEQAAPSARVHRPDLPAPWEHAIARCLRRAPEQRFARAADVIAALDPGPRRRWPFVAGGLALAAVGAGSLAFALAPGGGPSCEAPVLPDLYVDASARPGGTGSRACPLRTVTEALAIAAPIRTLHLAPGFYDAAHGEHFPLELRGELALIGAGVDRTTISGVGHADLAAAGGTVGVQPWQATVVAGDRAQVVRIEDLSLTSGLEHPQSDVVGVLCTRGRRDRPNTLVTRVHAGGGYGNVVIAAAETVPTASGCNLEIASSRLHDAYTGIWQLGCGLGAGHTPVDLSVHDTTFAGLRGTAVFPGNAIAVWDCAHSVVFERNHVTNSDAGITIVRHEGSEPAPALIRGNDFDGLTRGAIRLALSARAQILDNKLQNTTGEGPFVGRAAALWLQLEPGEAPQVVVRGNRFIENDIAVELAGTGPVPAAAQLDLGTAADPGNNVFVCNAAPAASAVAGGEVVVRVAAEAGAHLALAGNRWDITPPRVTHATANGVEILTPPGSPLAIDTSGARAHGAGCLQRTP